MPAPTLTIVLWSCGPDQPQGAMLVAAPLIYALSARALDCEVELHFTSSTVRWLVEGVAAQQHTDHARTRTVLDLLRECKGAGVRVLACTMALAEHRRAEDRLIEEVDGMAGAATVIAQALSTENRTLVF